MQDRCNMFCELFDSGTWKIYRKKTNRNDVLWESDGLWLTMYSYCASMITYLINLPECQSVFLTQQYSATLEK